MNTPRFLLLPLLAAILASPPLRADLVISEAMSSSGHPAVDGDWWELTNHGTTPVDLGGYVWNDDDAVFDDDEAVFPAVTIQPGESLLIVEGDPGEVLAWKEEVWGLDASVRVLGEEEFLDPGDGNGDRFSGLSSGGDEIHLWDETGTKIAEVSFPGATLGKSFAFRADGTVVGPSAEGSLGAYVAPGDGDGGDGTDVASPGVFVEPSDEELPPFFTTGFNDPVDFTITEGFFYFTIARAADPNENETLTLSLEEGPDWLALDDFGDGSADLFGTPQSPDVGPHPVSISASDSTDRTASLDFTLFVFNETSPVIVNEFNAVGGNELLDDGDKTDPFWGGVEGNGGDWFELVVVGDGSAGSTVDLRGWAVEIADDGEPAESVVLSQDAFWSAVPAGTILTFTEKGFDDGVLDSTLFRVDRFADEGWAWTNILVTDPTYVDQTASTFEGGFPVSNSDTRISLRDDGGAIRFGPVGEEFLADGGINDTEVLKLEQDPSPTDSNPILAAYADGSSSTFGAPNLWNAGDADQDFGAFRSAADPNSQPFFTFLSPRFARQGDFFSRAVTADDFDGTAGLSLELDEGPGWLSLTDNGSGSGTLSGTPPGDAATGLQAVSLSVSDGTDTATKSFWIYVHPQEAVVLLNEFNAVDPGEFLNGGDAGTDADGGAAADPVFGRVEGNGGDWFELVVVGDGTAGSVDLRGWSIELADNAAFPFEAEETIVLSDDPYWSSVPAGTILTFTEKRTTEGGLDTGLDGIDRLGDEGWAWSNVWIGDNTLIDYTDPGTNGYEVDPDTGEVSGINASNNDTWFVLRDSAGEPAFGPVGEGIAPETGVGNTEIFELETDPLPDVSPLTAAEDGPPAVEGYDDGSESTFGRPNEWNGGADIQDFSSFVPTAPGGPLESYLAGFGLSGNDLLPGADSDGDDATQIEEFAFGSNPTSGGSLPDFRESVREDGAADYLTLTFLRRSGGSETGATYSADGITYEVVGSLDLTGWNETVEATPNPADLPAPPAHYEWATYRLAQPIQGTGSTDRGFLRVNVSETAGP